MSKNIGEQLFEAFEVYFPTLASMTVSYYVSGRYEITARLNDGTTCVYDDVEHSIRQIQKMREVMTEEEWRRNFSRKLYKAMRDAGMSNTYMAEKTGISQITISKYIHAKATPTAYNLKKIADVLGRSVTSLTYFD